MADTNQGLDQIGTEALRKLLEDFHAATRLNVKITGTDPNDTLVQAGWTDFCSRYHWTKPNSAKQCQISHYAICAKSTDPGQILVRQCHNGLIHACMPIFIDGEICGYLLAGQILFSRPDHDFFVSQAEKYGFRTESYVKSIENLTIIDEDQLAPLLRLLSNSVELLIQKNRQLSTTKARLNRQETITKKIAELAPIAIGMAENRKVVWSNRAMSRITGYSAQELSGFAADRFYRNPETLLASKAIDEQYRQKGYSERLVRGVRKDGREVDTLLSSIPIDSTSVNNQVIFTVMDITDQLNDKKELEDAAERLKIIVEAAKVELWEWDLVTDQVISTGPHGEPYGQNGKQQVLLLSDWKTRLHSDDQSMVEKQIKRIKTGRVDHWNVTYRQCNTDSDPVWINSTGQVIEKDDQSLPVRAVGVQQDVTSLKQAEQKKLEENKKYREIFRHMNSAVIFLKVHEKNDFVIENFNPAAEIILKQKRHHIVDRDLQDIFSGEGAAPVLERLQSVLKTGQPEWLEQYHYQHADLDIWGDFYLFPLAHRKLAIIFNDYTEIKKAELKLKEHQEELEETNLTLRVLLKQYEQEKKNQEKKLAANVQMLVSPYLEKIKNAGLCEAQLNYLSIIETGLKDLSSPLAMISAAKDFKLSKAETKVADLVRQGLPSKKIADILNISLQTVHKHRATIRRKLGVANQKVNLSTLLNQLT